MVSWCSGSTQGMYIPAVLKTPPNIHIDSDRLNDLETSLDRGSIPRETLFLCFELIEVNCSALEMCGADSGGA